MDNKIELSQESAVAIENVFDSYVVRKITNDMNDNSADLKKSILGTEYSEEDNLKDLIKRDTGKIISSSNEKLINNLIKNLTDDEGSIPEIVEEKLNNRANALTEEISNALNEKIAILKSLIVEYDSRLSRMEKSTDQIRSDLNENSKDLQFSLFGSEAGEGESLNNLIVSKIDSIIGSSKESFSEYIEKKSNEITSEIAGDIKEKSVLIDETSNKMIEKIEKAETKLCEIESENEAIKKKLFALIAVEGFSLLGIIAMIVLFFLK